MYGQFMQASILLLWIVWLESKYCDGQKANAVVLGGGGGGGGGFFSSCFFITFQGQDRWGQNVCRLVVVLVGYETNKT